MYTDLMWLHVFAEHRYMEDLLELDRRRRVPTPDVPPALTSNPSRSSAETWQLSLAEHPDTRLKEYVINGIRDGYVDAALPFGLCSGPKIFNAVADTVKWILKQEGVACVFHYLDDFLLVGSPSSNQCEEHLKILLKTFDRLNIPVAMEKLEGPTTVLTFLGIEMDTQNSTLRLPRDKVQELKSLIATWSQRKSCTKRDLQSLVGKLQHACKVVRPGRSFLCRMFELLRGTAKKQHFIRLNRSFHSDLRWWHLFLESWNGVAMMGSREWQPKIHLFSDVSGSFGCGGWWDQSWLQVAWTSDVQEAQKELLPIVLAAMLWGKVWRGKAVLVH